MRPVRRGTLPTPRYFSSYIDAKPELVARLGGYCSYCEQPLGTQINVEHIQPKSLPQYAALEGRWDNFLLACRNCNSTKGARDTVLSEVYLPDRDNTFLALTYAANGSIRPAPDADNEIAQKTLDLAGLDKIVSDIHTKNGQFVALARIRQRKYVWKLAIDGREDIARSLEPEVLRRRLIDTALAIGYFSIWMTVFQDDAVFCGRLIDAFPGTRPSGCFDRSTSAPVSPAPNPDGLPNGGKL